MFAGLTCSNAATEQVRGDVTCSETSSENPEKCVLGGKCTCIVGCAAWAANAGGTPNTCPGNKLLSKDTSAECADNVCDESKCCVDPPGCNVDDEIDTKETPIGSSNGGCMCAGTFCATGSYCYNPEDLSGDSDDPKQCLVAAAPARCGSGSTGSFTCDAGTEPNDYGGCNADNSCTKELCCSMRSCSGEMLSTGDASVWSLLLCDCVVDIMTNSHHRTTFSIYFFYICFFVSFFFYCWQSWV